MTLQADGATVPDAAFCYERPLDGMEILAGRLCFLPSEHIALEVDGVRSDV